MKKLRVGIIGATGLVGREMIRYFEQKNIEIDSIRFFASEKSVNKRIKFNNDELKVELLEEGIFSRLDVALFSAGGEISKKFAPIAAKNNCVVIDNSSAFRRDSSVPLVVPEVNPEDLKNHNNIIANPNCSTIQLVVALKPILDNFGIKKLICSTYQSITGAGQKGLDKLTYEINDHFWSDGGKRIAYNAIFHPFEDDNTVEENKMIFETKRILKNQDLDCTFTCVRLPLIGGHSESVCFETEKDTDIDEIKNTLSNFNGITYIDLNDKEEYPTPIFAKGKDDVFIGRLRNANSKNSFWMWVVSDNLRKGAATNAIQIALKMHEMELI